MSKIKAVKVKKDRLPRNIYVGLSEIEKTIVKGDLIQHADSEQSTDFVFTGINNNRPGDEHAVCYELDSAKVRCFDLDAIKKSSRQIKKEKSLVKKAKKDIKKLKKRLKNG